MLQHPPTQFSDVVQLTENFLAADGSLDMGLCGLCLLTKTFHPRDNVHLLLPSSESKPMICWQGPFEILNQMSPVDYESKLLSRRKETKVYHVLFPQATEDPKSCSDKSQLVSPQQRPRVAARLEPGPILSSEALYQIRRLN